MKSTRPALIMALTAALLAGLAATPAAVAADTAGPGIVSGDWINDDFTKLDLQPVNNAVSVDSKFVGSIGLTPGANNAGTVPDGDSKALMLEAISAEAGAYKGGINRTVRTGIETRVKFSDTTSERDLFEVRSMTPPTGTGSWPLLLKFDASGNILDWRGNVLRPYSANEWYDINIDLDSPNHRYSAWLNGQPLVTDLDLGNYVGMLQNKIIQRANPAHTSTKMYLQYVKAGSIVPALQSFTVADGTVDEGAVYYPAPVTSPANAYTSGFTFTSSDENVVRPYGMALLARHTGTATITATETQSGVTSTFQLTVNKPAHPLTAHSVSSTDLDAALQVSSRPQEDWTYDQIMAQWPDAQTYMNMDESAFAAAVRNDSASITSLGATPKFAVYARVFAILYKQTGDSEYAKRALLIMYNYALDYPRILRLNSGGGAAAQTDIVWAFGSMIDSDVWGLLEPTVSASDLKQLIQEVMVRRLMNEAIDGALAQTRMGNLTPYTARPAAVVALMLDDAALARKVITTYDHLLSPDYFNADGMWNEETSSYNDLVSNNVAATIDVLKSFVDPEGYNDTQFGLKLNHTDLTSRWPLETMSMNFSTDKMIYPDGTPIPINDSDGKTGSPLPLPIVDKGLKNIALPDTGYYGLLQGDTTEATHIGLWAPKSQRYGSGHAHANFNGIDLWGGGVELLPYVAYVRAGTYSDGSGANLRFPAMSPVWGNIPWVWRADNANTPSNDWARPDVLAYDDGAADGKQVQVVETSDLGPAGKGADVNRRMEVMVNLGGNRNYVFDLSRLKGGQAHEIYQRGTELEGMSVKTNGITMTDTGQPNLDAYLKSINSTQGNPQYSNQLTKPMAGSGSNGFDFTWTGDDSGAAVHTFMNGVPGSNVFMSNMPRARVITTKADETKYLTPQITRRTLVTSPDQITQYGALYEPTGKGETDLVNGVDWIAPSDGDPMTTIAEVHSGQYNDIIYVSNDAKERTVNGLTFSGSLALARTDAKTGALLWSYVYGPGKVAATDYTLTGTDSQRLKIVGATTSSTNTGLDPDTARGDTITVSGTFANPQALVGKRIHTEFADGSGFSLKVLGAEPQGANTVLTVESFTPFQVTDTGVKTLFYPQTAIPGDAYVVFDQPATGTPDRTPPDAPKIASPANNSGTTRTPTVSGTGEAGATINVSIDGAQIGTVTAAADGTWSLQVSTQLGLGKHTATATATDAAGNVSTPSTPVAFTAFGVTAASASAIAADLWKVLPAQIRDQLASIWR